MSGTEVQPVFPEVHIIAQKLREIDCTKMETYNFSLQHMVDCYFVLQPNMGFLSDAKTASNL